MKKSPHKAIKGLDYRGFRRLAEEDCGESSIKLLHHKCVIKWCIPKNSSRKDGDPTERLLFEKKCLSQFFAIAFFDRGGVAWRIWIKDPFRYFGTYV